ncbi:Transcription factor CBF/NF-Y/archaeal histone domain [Trypanosoma melophagium]|uniref:Transcription factor CBF/NF-Y/archaeal histone domain n=1 Tax=Trypanosoma melophagium TaxID=715481 RepID=UPI003519F437|nr:Transcription factor CBF/NF-Y/archaeal histone domain [Trypanosoma melophagium]
MEEEGRGGVNEEMYDTITDGQVLDIHEAAFLTPRLAVFTDGGNQETESFNDYNESNAPGRGGVSAISTTAEEDTYPVLCETEAMWEKDTAHPMLFTGDEEDEQRVRQPFDHNETALMAALSSTERDDHKDEDDNHVLNDPNEYNEDEDDEDDEDEGEEGALVAGMGGLSSGRAAGGPPNPAAARGDRPTFPLSRVRELLKFHGSSSIVAKDAALTASDAVVLMLRELTRLAAAEAERQQRRTVTYADVARVVHYFDRFSFLSDIIPQPPETRSGAAKVMVGGTGKVSTSLASTSAATSAGAGGGAAKAGCGGARDGVSRQQTKGGGTTEEASRLRQATLRF